MTALHSNGVSIAQYEESQIVLELHDAQLRKRTKGGRCEERKARRWIA
jgi:hypothetical protein